MKKNNYSLTEKIVGYFSVLFILYFLATILFQEKHNFEKILFLVSLAILGFGNLFAINGPNKYRGIFPLIIAILTSIYWYW